MGIVYIYSLSCVTNPFRIIFSAQSERDEFWPVEVQNRIRSLHFAFVAADDCFYSIFRTKISQLETRFSANSTIIFHLQHLHREQQQIMLFLPLTKPRNVNPFLRLALEGKKRNVWLFNWSFYLSLCVWIVIIYIMGLFPNLSSLTASVFVALLGSDAKKHPANPKVPDLMNENVQLGTWRY